MSLLADLLARTTFPEGHINCAVSGGADSLALLALAVESGQGATAFHVDHGLRDGSSVEADAVAKIAADLGAQFVSLTVDVGDGANLEARARSARMAALPNDVQTGHTADDQAETMLINLMRGAAVDGMAAMSSVGHPILQLRRAETHALCAELGLTPFQDPSNSDERFVRNRVRSELMPLLDDIAGRDVAGVLSRQAPIFRGTAEMLNLLSGAVDPQDAIALANVDPILGSRAVKLWLSQEIDDEMHSPSAAAIERVLSVARGEATACEISNGVRVVRSHQRLAGGTMTRGKKASIWAAGAVVLVLVVIFWPFGLTKFLSTSQLQQQQLFAFSPTGFGGGTVTATEFNCDGATSNAATAVRTFTPSGTGADFVSSYSRRAVELKWKVAPSGYTPVAGDYQNQFTRKEGKHSLTLFVDANEGSKTWQATITESPNDHHC